MKDKFKNKKPRVSSGILKSKRSVKNIKKSVGIKTINEDVQQNEEESNLKDMEEGKKRNNSKQQLNDDYRPLPESDKVVYIVDYKIENVPNLIVIITWLFNKESLDISSLTIMFCCNLLNFIILKDYL